MKQVKAIERRKTIDELFAECSVPRLSDGAALRIIESSDLALSLSMDAAVERVGSVASGILIMEYNAVSGKESFRKTKDAFETFIARAGCLTRTTAAPPTEVRQAAQCISDWLAAQTKAEELRRGEKPATRRYYYRDLRIVHLFIELFGKARLSETVERPGVGNHGATARFILEFYAEMAALLQASRAVDERADATLDSIRQAWLPPTSDQIREMIRSTRKPEPDEFASD